MIQNQRDWKITNWKCHVCFQKQVTKCQSKSAKKVLLFQGNTFFHGVCWYHANIVKQYQTIVNGYSNMMSYVSRSTIFLMQYQTTCVDVDHSDEPHVPSTVPARVAQLWITTDLFARSWCLTWICLQMDLVVGESTTEQIGHGRDGWLW